VRFDQFLPACLQALREPAPGGRPVHGLRLLTRLLDGERGLQVVAAPAVESARLRQTAAGPVIEVGPAFLDRHVHDPRSALHLLAHEILHRVRGDLSRFVHVDALTQRLLGLALDMFVDAQLERLWFDGHGAPYQRSLYRANAFPELLLLPPRALLEAIAPERLEAILGSEGLPHPFGRDGTEHRWIAFHDELTGWLDRLGVRRASSMASLYQHAWFDHIGFAEFWTLFRQAVSDEVTLLRANLPQLLGDHDWRRGRRGDPRLDDELLQIFGRLLTVSGGYGADLSPHEITLVERKPDPAPVLAALRRAMDEDHTSPVVRRRQHTERGVVGRLGRAEALCLATGTTPLFWNQDLDQDVEDERRVQLYADASGSMHEQLPFLFRLVAALDDHVGDRVHLFSNLVATTDLSDIADGRYETTGGTDFDCILDHALTQRHGRILVITDGFARLDDGLASRARAAHLKVYVVLFGHWTDPDNPLCDLAEQVWEWEPP